MGAIEASSRGEVLLIDGNGGTRAFWGSNATRMAQLQGVAGVIIDGYSRDSVLSSEIDVLGHGAWTMPEFVSWRI